MGVAEIAVDLGERGRAERGLALPAEVHVDEDGAFAARVGLEVGREREADVLHRRERRDDERERRDLLALHALPVLPDGVHRAAVLADGDGDAELRAEPEADFLHGVVEDRVLARLAARGHPVGGEPDLRDVANVGGGEVGDRLGDGEAAGRRPVEERDRGALARRHGLSVERRVAHRRDGAVRRRKLELADHLVARDASGDGAVGDGDEKGLVRDGRQVQDAREGVDRADALEVRRRARRLDVLHLPHHARRLAEQDLDVHVDRPVSEVRILQDEASVAGRDADEGDGAPLARAEGLEEVLGLRTEREHVAFLGLAAPDLHRAHGRLLVVDLAELELAAGGLDELGAAVGESAGADVVDGEDGVGAPKRRAGVDHALAAALHLGVAALDGVEVEGFGVGAGHHRARGAAAEADAHRRAADLHDQGPDGDVALLHLAVADDAHAAGEHDRLVVAAQLARDLALVGAEEAAELRTPELVAERRAAQGAVRHDLQRRREARREVRELALPRLREAGDAQVGDHEAADAGDRARAGPRRRLVADLAADARRRARERRDRRRVVVRLDLHELVDLVALERVGVRLRVDREDVRLEARHHGRVVLVGRERVLRTPLVGVLDHLEEALGLPLAVDDELGPEDLVAAVLGVHLAEHDEFGVRRVALRLLERLGEIPHLLLRDRQADLGVRLANRRDALLQDVVGAAGLRLGDGEEVGDVVVDALGHLVVERGQRRRGKRNRAGAGLG